MVARWLFLALGIIAVIPVAAPVRVAMADGVHQAAPRRSNVARKKTVYRTVYYYRHDGWCVTNMRRLRNFEHEVSRDGRVSEDEMRIALSLKADLSHVCGRTHLPAGYWERYR